MKAKSFCLMIGLLIACLFFCSCAEEPSREDPVNQPSGEESTAKELRFTDDPERLEKAAESVVKLDVYDRNNNKIATGSGFAAVEEDILITASHVIVNMDHMTATTDDGETFTVGKVIEADRDKDVAVCLLPEGVRLPLLSFETEAPLRGEKTAVISSQFGVRNMVTLGNYCGSWNAGGVDWLLFSAPVSGGSSGAPVFNDRGNVIGIVTGTYEEGQTLNIATPASSVTDIYKKLSEGVKK